MSVVLKLVLVQLVLWGSFHPLLGMGNTAGQDTVSPTDVEQLYGRPVKEIRISALRYTKPAIIIRELASQVGEPYLKENTEKDAKRLDQLGIFSAIKIEPIEEGDGVVLEIEVKETFPYLPTISIDVSEENGLSIGPGIKFINLRGRAISFSASARFGGATSFGTSLENPWFAGNHLSYRLEFQQRDRRNEVDDFAEVSTEINVRLGSFVGEHGRIGGHFNFLSLGSDTPGKTLSADNRDNIPSLAFFIGYDNRDLWTNPHQGWWNEVEVSKSGGDADFWTVNFDVRKFQPLANRHTLAFFTLTTLQTGTVGVEIPEYLDFHFGGTNSIRGWGLDSTEGKNQFINTIEYRYDLMVPRPLSIFGVSFYLGLQLALFGDLGTAWGDNQENQWLDGYGFGLRILLPFVDMIRFDFAFGEPGKGLNSQIGIGEKAVKQRRRVR